MLRRLAVLRSPAAAGWLQVPHRSCDYPELKDVPMYRSIESDAPQPVLVLGGKGGLELTSKICKEIKNPAGCVGLELPERAVDAEWMADQCELIEKFLNVLYCPWVHVISHSVGSLVALDLARRFPARVGTITVLDTVLSTPRCAEETDLRDVLVRSERDVNITDADIDKTKQRLAELAAQPNELLQAPVAGDKELFEALTAGVPSEDATTKQFFVLPYLLQQTVKHPMLLVRPGKEPTVGKDLLRHYRNTFHIKDAANVPAAATHDDLFSKGAADVAAEVNAFHNKYSIQHLVERQWEEIKEAKLKSAASRGRDTTGDEKESKQQDKGQKQGKKKKKKQKE